MAAEEEIDDTGAPPGFVRKGPPPGFAPKAPAPRATAAPPGFTAKAKTSAPPPGFAPKGTPADTSSEGPTKDADVAIAQSMRAGKQGIEMLRNEANQIRLPGGELSVAQYRRDHGVSMDGPSEADIAASEPKPNPMVQALGTAETIKDVRDITDKQFATAKALQEAQALSKTSGHKVDASQLPPPPSEDPIRPGLLQRVVDYLTRPISTVAGATKAAVEGGSLSDVGSAALDGLTGKQKTFMADVLKSAGVPELGSLEGDVLDLPRAAAGKFQQNHLKVTGRDVAGFGLDVAADPLTYVSAGYGRSIPLPSGVRLSEEGAKLLRTGIEAATESGIERGAARRIAEEGVQTAIDEGAKGLVDKGGLKFAGKTIPGTGEADQALRGVIKTTAAKIRATPAGEKLWQAGRRVRGLYQRDAALADVPDYVPDKQEYLDRLKSDLQDAEDEAAVIFHGTGPKDQEAITQAIESDRIDALPPEQRRVAKALNEAQIELRKADIANGLGDTVRDNYMMHAYENYPSLRGQGGGGISPNMTSNEARVIPTLQEAEAIGLKPVTKNAYELFIMRKMASARALRSKELIEKAGQKYGIHGLEIEGPRLAAEGGNPRPGLDESFVERAGRSSAGKDKLEPVKTIYDYETYDGRRLEAYKTRDGRGLWAVTSKDGDRTVTYAARRVGDSNVRMRITRDADGVTRLEFGRPRAKANGPLMQYRDAVPPRVHAKDAEFAVDAMHGEMTTDEFLDSLEQRAHGDEAKGVRADWSMNARGADKAVEETARELLGDEFLVYKKPGDTSESYFLKPPKYEKPTPKRPNPITLEGTDVKGEHLPDEGVFNYRIMQDGKQIGEINAHDTGGGNVMVNMFGLDPEVQGNMRVMANVRRALQEAHPEFRTFSGIRSTGARAKNGSGILVEGASLGRAPAQAGKPERFIATPESIRYPGSAPDGELILEPAKLRAVPKDAPAGGMLPRSTVSAEVKARAGDLSLENIDGGLARGIEGPELQAASKELSRIFPGANNLRNAYDDSQKLLGGVPRVPLREPGAKVTIGLPESYRIAHDLVPLPNATVRAAAPEAQTQLPLAIQGGARTERTVVGKAAEQAEGRQIFVPRAIAEDIAGMGNVDYGVLKPAIDVLDRMTNLWKGSVTSLFPAFHARNAMSNVQNMFLRIGVDALNPIRHAQASALLRGTADEFYTRLGERYTMKELARVFREEGLENSFAARAELATSRTTGEVIGDNPLFQKGRAVGNKIENEAKATVFLSEIRQGMTPKQAAQTVKQYLFDYDNLSMFEREILRRAMPFITFRRKNIPLQLKALAENPGRQAVVAKFFATPGDQAQIERDMRNLPDFVTNGLARKVGTDKNGRPVYLWSTNAPIEDLNYVLPRTRASESVGAEQSRNWLTMLNPFVKFLVEEASGKDLFLDRPLKDVNQIYSAYGQQIEKMPEPVKDWLGFRREYTRKGDVRYEMDPQKFHLLRSFFLSRLYSTGGKLMDPTKDPVTRALNTFTGMRIGSVDYETQVYPKLRQNADDRLKAAREEKKQQERTLLIEGAKRPAQPGGSR